jgi:glycosyltransferase involved in cell wall biosynthesis
MPTVSSDSATDLRDLILIPAYNEEESLPRVVKSLEQLSQGFDLLIVNDGSRDRTGAIAEELARQSTLPIRVLHLPINCGIGGAVQAGYRFALHEGRYRYVIQFDADGQHDAAHILSLVRACEERQLDLCVGSRFLDPKARTFQSTFLRRLGIRFFAWLISRLSSVRVTDPTSGFRCAGPRAWRHFAVYYPEDYPEPESVFWCARNRLRVGEVQVEMHARQGGVTSIRYLKTAYYMLKVTLAILLDRLRAKEHS